MDKFVINGGTPLSGEVEISGAKNAVLPIMAATMIIPGNYTLYNVPSLKDTFTMVKLMEIIGAQISFNNNKMLINTHNCNNPIAPYDLVKTMRASFYVLGPFMSRFNEAHVSLPGGCAWGPRPVNYHLDAMEKMGAQVVLKEGMMILKGTLNGANIHFTQQSVGATGNTLMAAIKAKGTTTIKNAAIEPEIQDLCLFLHKMGAKIEGIGTTTLIIEGTDELNADIEYTIIPDRIEAGTFLIAAAITHGNIKLTNVIPDHLDVIIKLLIEAGLNINVGSDYIKISSNKLRFNPINIMTGTYPEFPTDLQAQWMALMLNANGTSSITENIYKDRFTHIAELNRFGANITLENNTAIINGCSNLKGAPVMSTDIRASASLILAALSAKGESTISRIYHIDRGYEKIEDKLKLLNANINRIV